MMSPYIEQKYEIEHDTSKSDLKCLAALSTFFSQRQILSSRVELSVFGCSHSFYGRMY